MILRVFLAGPPARDQPIAWARLDDAGRVLERGAALPGRWPAGARVEGVLAADAVRLVTLDLPPMPVARLRAAAAYAIEDRLATSIDESVVATGPQRDDGSVLAAVAAAATVAAVVAGIPGLARLIPEPALAPVHDGWTWCASAAGGTFIRRSDGSTVAIGDVPASGELPGELSAALTQARHGGQGPQRVHVAFAQDTAVLARWSQAAGIAFVPADAFRWDEADAKAIAQAPDLLAREQPAPAASAAAGATLRAFRLPLAIAALALGVHVLALVAQWSWLSVDRWRTSRALVDVAAQAGVPDASSPSQAVSAIARRHAELLHRASKEAAGDALPLLARAAPLLATRAQGTLKSATYAGGAWTLDFAATRPDALAAITRGLADAGVDALVAPVAAGTRMRLTLDPAAP
ncbi:MAG TPA: type II secretion system protein GspL [Casimicrobiaceae bacterium]|nr:type II secretion system protein GspL [Casimicrobiaceae bacterium]